MYIVHTKGVEALALRRVKDNSVDAVGSNARRPLVCVLRCFEQRPTFIVGVRVMCYVLIEVCAD